MCQRRRWPGIGAIEHIGARAAPASRLRRCKPERPAAHLKGRPTLSRANARGVTITIVSITGIIIMMMVSTGLVPVTMPLIVHLSRIASSATRSPS